MNKYSNSKFSSIMVLLDISSKGRKKFINDIINDEPTLYDLLYHDSTSDVIFKIFCERYDLLWLKYHWDKIQEYIIDHKLQGQDKAELLLCFSKWYLDFVSTFDDSQSLISSNTLVIQELLNLKINTLESIIDFDKRCDQKIKQTETSFKRTIKQMNHELNRMINERKN